MAIRNWRLPLGPLHLAWWIATGHICGALTANASIAWQQRQWNAPKARAYAATAAGMLHTQHQCALLRSTPSNGKISNSLTLGPHRSHMQPSAHCRPLSGQTCKDTGDWRELHSRLANMPQKNSSLLPPYYFFSNGFFHNVPSVFLPPNG